MQKNRGGFFDLSELDAEMSQSSLDAQGPEPISQNPPPMLRRVSRNMSSDVFEELPRTRTRSRLRDSAHTRPNLHKSHDPHSVQKHHPKFEFQPQRSKLFEDALEVPAFELSHSSRSYPKEAPFKVSTTLKDPPFKFYDFYLFSIGMVHDGSIYLGLFQTWLKLTGPTLEPTTRMDQGDPYNQAHQLKADKKYLEAAPLFVKASELFAHENSITSPRDSIKALEEAFNSFKAGGQKEKGIPSLIKAAELLMTGNKTIEKAAKHYKTAAMFEAQHARYDKATTYYLKSLQGFQAVTYGPHVSVQTGLANAYAMQQKYEDASAIYTRIIVECGHELSLRHSIHRYIVAQICCSICQGHWNVALQHLDRAKKTVQTFDGSPEHTLLLCLISHHSQNTLEFNRTLDSFLARDFGIPWIGMMMNDLYIESTQR